MSNLVERLKSDHQVLSKLLVEIKEMGVGTDASKQKLMQAKSALLNHLGQEDKELYPVLKKAAANNEDINRKLTSFGKDMEEITQFVLEFFDNVEKDTYSRMDYAKNFGKLIAVLSGRISREENVLYPLYESCV